MTTHRNKFATECLRALELFYHLSSMALAGLLKSDEAAREANTLFDELEADMTHHVLCCEMYTWAPAGTVPDRHTQREHLSALRGHGRIMLDYTNIATWKLVNRCATQKLGSDKAALSDAAAKDIYKHFWKLLNERFDRVREVCEDEKNEPPH